MKRGVGSQFGKHNGEGLPNKSISTSWEGRVNQNGRDFFFQFLFFMRFFSSSLT